MTMTADRNMNGVTGHATESFHEVVRPSPIKRAILALITLIPALATLSIINIAVTQLLVAHRPTNTPQPQPRAVNGQVPKKNALPPKIVTKTVYIEPSQTDLARLRQELEASDLLPPIDKDERRSNQLEFVASSLKSAADARKKKLNELAKESADLNSAHVSSIQRFEEDISLAAASEDEKIRVATVLNEKLSSLRDVLSLSEFSRVDRANLTNMFDSARSELDRLLKSTDEQLFLNAEGVLLEALMNGTSKNSQSECSPSFLKLDDKNVTTEFIIPPGAKVETQKVKAATPVPIGTARESDLFQSVESIKNILSRRDVILLKVDGSMHSPLSPEGTESIRRAIVATANNVKKQRQDHVDQQKELRLQWMSKVESSTPIHTVMDGDDSMCANSNLVEHMVAGGLEGLRKKSDLGTAVRTALFPAFVDESNQNGENTGEKMKLLTQAMKNIVAPQINYDEKKVHSSASKKSRQSVSYLVDGPLLHIGLVGWTNYFVDFISGYNDNVDALLDWIVGESQSTVGEIFVDVILRLVRQIPFHDQIVGHAKSVGILGGRTRSLLEE